MSPLQLLVFVGLAGYLIGSIPFGFLVARARGVDIFKHGSGNIGATNVGRVLGKKFGLLVFALDFAKGALPTAAALRLAPDSDQAAAFGVSAGLASLLGHLFPIFLRFHGGKGVATGAGVVAVLVPIPALTALITWIAVVAASRYVSLASISAAMVLCATQVLHAHQSFALSDRILTLFCWIALALVMLRHRANLGRLVHGTENRIGSGPATLLLTKTVHVLSVGLWFGMVVFFILAALVIFQAFESLAAPGAERPSWLPLPADFNKEKATQLAGVAIGPLFDCYFPLQGACALLALGTALGWASGPGASLVHRIRAGVLIAAFATVVIGWPLARYVGKLRLERYAVDTAAAEQARAAFTTWHLSSLLLNLVTLFLVATAMALCAQLPIASDGAKINRPAVLGTDSKP